MEPNVDIRPLVAFAFSCTLLVLGLVIMLKSGGSSIASVQGVKQFASNITWTIVLVSLCLVGMIVAGRIAGFHAFTR